MKKIYYLVTFIGILLVGFLFFKKPDNALRPSKRVNGFYYSVSEYKYSDMKRSMDSPNIVAPLPSVKKISKWSSKKACTEYLKLASTKKIKPLSAICDENDGFDRYFLAPHPTGEYFFVYSLKNRHASKNGTEENEAIPIAKSIVIHFGKIVRYESKTVPCMVPPV